MNTLFGNLPATNCSRCGRVLTDPTSVKLGVGPVCRGYRGLGDAPTDGDEEQFTDYFLPFDPVEDGIVLKRDELGVHTNVPHLVTHHSPTGFEFGYGGSGPADLALNIVEMILHRMGYDGPMTKCWGGECYEKAYELHQSFKRQFVAGVPHQGCVIPLDTATSWVRGCLQ